MTVARIYDHFNSLWHSTGFSRENKWVS